jgi:hypothetical protein
MQTVGEAYRESTGIRDSFDAVVIGALVGGVLASSAVLGRDLMRDIRTPAAK